jgi:hypothetical protein
LLCQLEIHKIPRIPALLEEALHSVFVEERVWRFRKRRPNRDDLYIVTKPLREHVPKHKVITVKNIVVFFAGSNKFFHLT